MISETCLHRLVSQQPPSCLGQSWGPNLLCGQQNINVREPNIIACAQTKIYERRIKGLNIYGMFKVNKYSSFQGRAREITYFIWRALLIGLSAESVLIWILNSFCWEETMKAMDSPINFHSSRFQPLFLHKRERKKWQIDKKSWQVVNAFPKESLWEHERWAILSEQVQLERWSR